MTDTAPTARRIVVGVDGSPPSVQALRWALGQAEVTGATVEAVAAWEIPASYGMPMTLSSDEDVAGSVERSLEATVGQAAAEHPEVLVERQVRRGHPALMLLEQAKGAELLVVGSHGHGGFVSALLGSVSQYCIHHATCPVVVVRAERQPGHG